MSWTIDTFPIFELTTGDELSLKTYTLKGNRKGPHIHIQANVHGAELQGNALILRLMEFLKGKDINGSITFIPMANPLGLNNKQGIYTAGRFNPHTGDNWNRNYIDIIKKSNFDLKDFCQSHIDTDWDEIKSKYKSELKNIFASYIDKLKSDYKLSENNYLNLILQKTASASDGILDLHTGPIATEYLYCAYYEKEIATYLNFPHVLMMPDEFAGAMDEAGFMPWIYLREEFKNQGREIALDIESFTLELGSEEQFSMKTQEDQLEGIINYLKYKGCLEGEAKAYSYKSCDLSDYKTYHAPKAGFCEYKVSVGSSYKKGDVLASIYNLKELDPNSPIESTEYDLLAQEDGIIINYAPSSAIQMGMELFQVMTNINE